MDKLITLFNHTNHNEDIQIVDEISLKLVSYSEDRVTLLTELNTTDYQETTISKKIDSKFTDETDCLNLDFKQNNIQEAKVNNKTYKIKLMNIEKKLFEGEEILFITLFVSY
jgi:hypothetical protein